MTRLTVTQTTDYSVLPGSNTVIDELVFAEEAFDPVIATFRTTRTKFSTTLSVEGGVASDEIRVQLDSTVRFYSLANWTFSNWGSDDHTVLWGTDNRNNLTGSSQDDLIYGYGQRDELIGGLGDDTLDGGAHWDTLFGGDGDDLLLGGAGDDILRGDAGDDEMHGGEGDDTYYVDSAGDQVIEEGEGRDTVYSSVDYTLGPDVEELRLSGDRHLGIGNNGSNAIYGSFGSELLKGLGGDDVIEGSSGGDTLRGGAGGDTLRGGSGADLLFGEAGDDYLSGGYYHDHGKSGADTLRGGEGNDTLFVSNETFAAIGDVGDDTYVIDLTASPTGAPVIIEAAGPDGGVDTIMTFSSLVLDDWSPNIENIIARTALGGPTEIDIVANDGANRIEASSGSSGARFTISGEGGADTITGSSIRDDISGGEGDDSIDGGSGNDSLNGNQGSDTLYGGIGNDTLDGGEDADTLAGGAGDDTYIQSGPDADTLIEEAGGGVDTVTSAFSVSLVGLTYVENVLLTGSDAVNAIGNGEGNRMTGNDAANTLSGGDAGDKLLGEGGNDILNGEAGPDTLIGGAGADTMAGGDGDDVYLWDTTGAVDTIVEEAGGGIDTVRANRTASLAAADYVERLELNGNDAIDGSGNASDNYIAGNGAANRLAGGNGNDSLGGGAGADTLAGGKGNDLLAGGGEEDIYVFADTRAGTDTIVGFAAAEDRFDLSGGSFTAMSDDGASTTLQHDGGTIIVQGVSGLDLGDWNALVHNGSGAKAAGGASMVRTAAVPEDTALADFVREHAALLAVDAAALSHADFAFV